MWVKVLANKAWLPDFVPYDYMVKGANQIQRADI